MIGALEKSNATQVAEAARMVKATGARKVAVLGLAFKPGTDDLRESPILEVMADLLESGIEVTAHDPAVTSETRIEAQLAYVAHASKGLGQLANGLRGMLAATASDAIAHADAIIVTHAHADYRALAASTDKPVIDVARLWKSRSDQPANLHGIGW